MSAQNHRIRPGARHSHAMVAAAIGLWLVGVPQVAWGQQQFAGLCARVKIEILQELTIERIGFEATLEVTNNDGEDPITDFSASLTFEDPLLSTNGIPHDAADQFFVRAPTLRDIEGVAGDGVIGPTKTAVIKWFIIPKIAAGGTTPNGRVYRVGCDLGGKMRDVQIPGDVLFAVPDTITVRPEPQLEITYFQPRDVQGDDPFTPNVESPIPFTLGVLVKNAGHGVARKLKIDSQQPKIVENRQNLLLVAQLLGARVQDSPLQRASLVVDLGDIPPGQARKGAWDMITSLSGEFVEFKASYTHASDLGGEATSVITSLEAHFIAHEVLNDEPGRDTLKDFLADTDRDPDMVPDALYESEGNVLPVNQLLEASISGSGMTYQVTLEADREGWGYLRLSDPAQARLPISSVIRSDGKEINPNNVWTNVRYERGTNRRLAYLNLLDRVELGAYTYAVTYAPTAEDTTPPVTTLEFAGTVSEVEGKFYVTRQTQMYFLSEDASPVSIYYSLTNGPFVPALPFWLRSPGEFDLRYYAQDTQGNTENTNTAVLVLFDDAPGFAAAAVSQETIVAAGDALSVRPSAAVLSFQATPNPTRLDAEVEVFRGVLAWVTVGNVPSSPTRQNTAALAIGGSHVDHYRYRLDGGAWSGDRPVAQALTLSGLGAGPHTVHVQGRSQHGGYPPDDRAVAVSWTVDPTAPTTTITGAPATPTADRIATLTVGGEGVSHYRWTIDGGYYRPETAVDTPLTLTALENGTPTISMIAKTNGVYQATNNATTVTWTIDPAYGGDFSLLERIRHTTFADVSSDSVQFSWDGRDDAGVLEPAGWYVAKVTLRDELGRAAFFTRLIHLGEITGTSAVLVETTRGARRAHARGHWVVWQDQSDGNYEIYAADLRTEPPAPIQITSGLLNQEEPFTDGRYVVWQSRAEDGNWEIRIKDLSSNDPAVQVTHTPHLDEINPVVDSPWVVYQAKARAVPDAPWQLAARNLVTGDRLEVDPSAHDQLDPDIQGDRVVWQDHRDVGFGEIYFRDLETGETRRLTTNQFGQYFPAIHGPWIVWQDNRNTQVDIYGFNLLRNTEVRLTQTAENEAHPRLEGPWLLCEEDSAGASTANLRLVHLPSLRSVALTRTRTMKRDGALANDRLVYGEETGSGFQVVNTRLPAIQAVFENQNAIPITAPLAASFQTAFALLEYWNAEAGVEEISTFAALVPDVVRRTARWANHTPAGDDFVLTPGGFLWVGFDARRVLDLGLSGTGPIDLAPGVNALGYTGFPAGFRAFALLRQLGLDRARGVRMLEAESGRWVTAGVRNGALVGEDFAIPRVAVLLIDLASPVNQYQPE